MSLLKGYCGWCNRKDIVFGPTRFGICEPCALAAVEAFGTGSAAPSQGCEPWCGATTGAFLTFCSLGCREVRRPLNPAPRPEVAKAAELASDQVPPSDGRCVEIYRLYTATEISRESHWMRRAWDRGLSLWTPPAPVAAPEPKECGAGYGGQVCEACHGFSSEGRLCHRCRDKAAEPQSVEPKGCGLNIAYGRCGDFGLASMGRLLCSRCRASAAKGET